MEWSEDLGGLRLAMRREADSPQHIVLEFDVRDRELLKNKPLLKISATVQRLESKWQGLVSKEANRDTRIIFRGAVPIDTPRQTFEIENVPFYDFQGEEIESFCTAELGHSGATGEQRVPNPPPFQISNLTDASPITEPKDRIDESTNFARLPKQTKMLVYLQQALLLVLFAWTLDWGLSGEINEWKNKDGESPVGLWIAALFGILVGVYVVRKNALSQYLLIEHSKTSRLNVVPGKTYSISDVIEGKAKIDIENALFRVVCCNRERYKNLEPAGDTRDWIPRYRDFNGHVLYERKISRVPAGSWLSDHLPKRDIVRFDTMFKNLYPQALVSRHYGVSVYWEAQIIHDEFVDIEIPVLGKERHWPFEHFVQHPAAEEKVTDNRF